MLLEFRGQPLRILFPGQTEDVCSLEIGDWRVQEQNAIMHPHSGRAENDTDTGIVRRLNKYLRGGWFWKKDGAVVLINSFGGEARASLFPLDNLGMDSVETVVLQTLRGGSGERHATEPDSNEGSRSHDSILSLPDFHMP